ncbi:MAG TPA: hypothetical protein PKK15_17275, partial [Kouleothrix sp.]|nr:hypothetical protein [Kouleothrix sp.]
CRAPHKKKKFGGGFAAPNPHQSVSHQANLVSHSGNTQLCCHAPSWKIIGCGRTRAAPGRFAREILAISPIRCGALAAADAQSLIRKAITNQATNERLVRSLDLVGSDATLSHGT